MNTSRPADTGNPWGGSVPMISSSGTSADGSRRSQQLHARLREATDTTRELQRHLAALAEAEEEDRAAAATLHEATAQMKAYLAQLHAVTEAALTALPSLQSALQQAETFLAATDLSQVIDDLAETREMIRTVLDDRIRSTEQERETTQRELEIIRDRAAKLPARHRRSLQID